MTTTVSDTERLSALAALVHDTPSVVGRHGHRAGQHQPRGA